MPDENIKYKSETAKTTITAVRDTVQSGLEDKKTKYDDILNNFNISECMQATSLRSMIGKEKDVVDALISLYIQMLTMLENASNDIDTTEQTYSKEAGMLFFPDDGQIGE